MQWGVLVAWVAVLGTCAVACAGDVSSSGGNAANGGDVSSSGGNAAADDGTAIFHDPGSVISIPAPPDDACAPLKEVWARVPPAMDGSLCPMLSCDACPGGFLSYQERGCLVSVDCAALCSDTGRLYYCLGGYDVCTESADCSPGLCVKEDGQSMGECATGTEGARCRTDAHCPGGRCVAVNQSGRRECTTAKQGAACNEGAHCDGGHCVFPAWGSFLGTCSDRVSGSPCRIEEEDCVGGLVCIGATNTSLGMCGPS